MSEEAVKLIGFMLKELSGMTHGYRRTVEGCFDYAVVNHGYDIPKESKEDIVDNVIRILNKG